MVVRDESSRSDFRGLQSVTMHELGHALSVGWADDAPIPYVGFACSKCYEVYNGNPDPTVTGGVDPTNETIDTGVTKTPEWSIMRSGTAEDTRAFTPATANHSILGFSIGLSTTDLEHLPSKTED